MRLSHEHLDLMNLFAQYVDLKNRDLSKIVTSEGEPPTFSDEAFDTARAYTRIKDYLTWTENLNDQRKAIGDTIANCLNVGNTLEAAQLAGMQEVSWHLITITGDAVAKHFNILSQRIEAEVDTSITYDLNMFGTLRNDFEHPDDKRGLSERHGKKIFTMEPHKSGGTRAFNWGHEPGDLVASRKESVPINDEGIQLHRKRTEEGLQFLEHHCTVQMYQILNDIPDSAVNWMIQRRIILSVPPQPYIDSAINRKTS
ncbi:MAG: hypothetical protein WBA63_09265 [Thermomicrobiales bacterium]